MQRRRFVKTVLGSLGALSIGSLFLNFKTWAAAKLVDISAKRNKADKANEQAVTILVGPDGKGGIGYVVNAKAAVKSGKLKATDKKTPKGKLIKAADQKCANCALYTQVDGKSGKCVLTMSTGTLVHAAASCNSYSPKDV